MSCRLFGLVHAVDALLRTVEPYAGSQGLTAHHLGSRGPRLPMVLLPVTDDMQRIILRGRILVEVNRA